MKRPLLLRSDLIYVALLLMLTGLIAHQVMVLRNGQLPQHLTENSGGTRIIQPLAGRPGNIYARSNRSYILIASSCKVPGCFVDPGILDEARLGEVSCALAGALDMDPGEIYSCLSLRGRRRFAWVKKELTSEEVEKCLALNEKAVGIQYEWKRTYPCGNLAGTVIGARRLDNVPVCGLEQSIHRAIKASDGKQIFQADAGRRPFALNSGASLQPRDGHDVFLTIDVNIQEYLQEAVSESVEKFDAEWGTGVVINPRTGDVLAMSSSPTFDPNKYNTTPADHMFNRAISYPFEPGSVFKPLIAASAVEEGVVRYETKLFCENGTYRAYRGGRITDHGNHYGYLSVRDGVVVSSNILMAKTGEKLGNSRLYKIVRGWGFGRPTGIPLPADSKGIVRPCHRWDGYSLRRVPFGQEISASTLQVAMAFAAIANHGVLMRPRLVTSIADSKGVEVCSVGPKAVRRVISPGVANQTLDVMKEVVERGTGKNCRMEYWTSWGKTGTAQVAGNGGYIDDAYTGSFIGGAPVEKPAVICLISIYRPDRHKGYYGSIVAAPYVKNVLEKTLTYLRVPPDKTEGMIASGNQ